MPVECGYDNREEGGVGEIKRAPATALTSGSSAFVLSISLLHR